MADNAHHDTWQTTHTMTRGRQRTDRDERRRRHVLQEGAVWCGIAAQSEQTLPITTAAGCNAACCTLSVPCCTLIMLQCCKVAMLQGGSMLHAVCSMLHVGVVYYELYYVAKVVNCCYRAPPGRQRRPAPPPGVATVALQRLRCGALRCNLCRERLRGHWGVPYALAYPRVPRVPLRVPYA